MEDDCKVLSELKFDGRQGNCEMQVCLLDLKQKFVGNVCCRKTRLCGGVVCSTGGMSWSDFLGQSSPTLLCVWMSDRQEENNSNPVGP